MLLHQKVRTSTSEEPPLPPCPQWTTPSPRNADVLYGRFERPLIFLVTALFVRSRPTKVSDYPVKPTI